MRVFLFFYAALVGLYFSTGYTFFLSRPLLSGSPRVKTIEPRQAPGVIATSEFLRRGYQASVVVGNWVYIDGGEFSFLSNGTPVDQYASTLLSIDLSQNWTNASVTVQSTTKPNGAPNLNSPSLWYHELENLIYSGFTGWTSVFGNEPNIPPLSLWTFEPDGSGSGVWNEIIAAGSSMWSQLTRPAQPFMAFGADSAWILGGIMSEFAKSDALLSPETLIPGMVRFDMASRSFSNSSAQCCNATGNIYKGALQYVPIFGPEGIHIAMGGTNGFGDLIEFSTVSVFDPAKQEWWNQTTTGSEPSPRIEFCTAGINSTDGTYEIFVYAGWDGKLGAIAIQYDTISILTLPAFHWISVSYNPENPRHGLSCNAIGGSQILTIGGVDSRVQSGVGQDPVERTFDGSRDPFAQGLAIFDMTAMAFSDQYTARAPPYEQSEVVKQFYAQSQPAYVNNIAPGIAALLQVTNFSNNASNNTSSATKTLSPTSYASNPNVGAITGGAAGGPATETPSPISHASKSKIGAIAGGAAGGVAVLASIATGAFFFLKKRNRARSDSRILLANEQSFADQSLNELQERTRPVKPSGQALQELSEQSVQEMAQPPSRMEMYGF